MAALSQEAQGELPNGSQSQHQQPSTQGKQADRRATRARSGRGRPFALSPPPHSRLKMPSLPFCPSAAGIDGFASAASNMEPRMLLAAFPKAGSPTLISLRLLCTSHITMPSSQLWSSSNLASFLCFCRCRPKHARACRRAGSSRQRRPHRPVQVYCPRNRSPAHPVELAAHHGRTRWRGHPRGHQSIVQVTSGQPAAGKAHEHLLLRGVFFTRLPSMFDSPTNACHSATQSSLPRPLTPAHCLCSFQATDTSARSTTMVRDVLGGLEAPSLSL